MERQSVASADPVPSQLLQLLCEYVAEPETCNLNDVLATIGRTLDLKSALWLWTDGAPHRLAAHPLEALDVDAVESRVGEWVNSLTEPRVLTELSEADPRLANDSVAQVIWPLQLEGSERAIWLLESKGSVLPDITAEPQLVRAAVLLTRSREHQAACEVQLRDLRSAQELMGHIVDALPVGLYVVDKDYRIVAWNRKRETGTQGVAREDAIGKSVFEVLYRQPEERIKEELEEVFESDEIRHYEVSSDASGERRYYRLTKVPMHLTGTDDVTHVITVGEDVTEQKQIREQISHAEKLAALGQMAAGVMHEINNPLATITASAEAVQELVEPRSEAGELLSMIETEVERCKRIARDLLAFSRPPPSEKGPVDTQETVEETLKLLRHHDRFKKISVQREYVYDLPLVWANAERLIQVFVALALNALDAMEDDGELRVRTEIIEDGDTEVAISFIDTGCGIPQSDLPKIFEPFYTSKKLGKGTGLGLSICYGIIHEHGGRIEVDSMIGAGSNFRVVLPAYLGEDTDDAPPEQTTTSEERTG